MVASTGYFESSPLLTAVTLRLAARRATLADSDTANLQTVLSTPANLAVAGQALDEALAATGATGGGLAALLQLLIANLPAILQLIMTLISITTPAQGEVASQKAPTARKSMATDFALPPLPPVVLTLIKEAVVAAMQAVLPTVEADLKNWLKSEGLLSAA